MKPLNNILLFVLIFYAPEIKGKVTQDSTLVNRVIHQLDLDPSKIHRDFIVSKVWPNNTQETILLIPVIEKEEEDYFKLYGYLLIVNNLTGKIINKYFDRSGWVSDAIELSKLEIDVGPYRISENDQAFGIRDHCHNRSQPNPYSNSKISLYVKSGETLKKILNNYEVMSYGAEWDTQCAGESVGHQKEFLLSTDKTNGNYDILVENTITYSSTYLDENEDCIADEKISTEKSVLKFNGEEYTPDGEIPSLNVYLSDSDKSPTNIRLEPNGKIILKLKEDNDYFTLTITEENKGWFKVMKIIGVEGNNIEISGGIGWDSPFCYWNINA